MMYVFETTRQLHIEADSEEDARASLLDAVDDPEDWDLVDVSDLEPPSSVDTDHAV